MSLTARPSLAVKQYFTIAAALADWKITVYLGKDEQMKQDGSQEVKETQQAPLALLIYDMSFCFLCRKKT
jgi:hypothetical protein